NHQVSPMGERQQISVTLPRKTCSITQQGKYVATIFKTVTVGSIRMIERTSPQHHVVIRTQDVSRLEIPEFDRRLENLDLHRKQRRTHKPARNLLDTARRHEICRPDSHH